MITNLLVGGGRWVCARWVDPELALSPSLVRIAVLRDITNFSAWVFVINLATQVVYRTSPIIIAALLGVALVTPFALANSLIQYLRRMVDPVLAVLLPAYAELSAVDDAERVRRLFVGGSRAVGAISLPMVLAMVLLGRPFIDLWVGEGYEQTGVLLFLLAPPLFLSFLVAAGDKLLWAKGKVRVNSYVAIVDTVLNLGLSVTLTLAVGLPGVALATLISVLTTNGLWLMPYICREAGLPARAYLTRVLWPIFVPAAPATAVVLLLTPVIGVASYLSLVLLGACCAGSYWGTYLALNARSETFALVAGIRSRLVGRHLVAGAP
jgi:O-antigen/teichoic acid export membrane protein